jgi:hypothetical protein
MEPAAAVGRGNHEINIDKIICSMNGLVEGGTEQIVVLCEDVDVDEILDEGYCLYIQIIIYPTPCSCFKFNCAL